VGGWDDDDSGTWKAAAAATMWQGHRRVRQLNDVTFFSGGREAQAQLKTGQGLARS